MTTAEITAALIARGYAVNSAAGLKGAIEAFQAVNRDATGKPLAKDGIAGPKTQWALSQPIPAVPQNSAIGGLVAGLLTDAALRKFEPFSRADIRLGLVSAAPKLEAAGITTRLRLVHFLAQVSHETQGLARLEENLSYSAARLREVWPSRFPTLASATPYARNPVALANKVYGGRLGNNRPGDGYLFRGGGGLMTTGGDNYREAGHYDDPDFVRSVDGFLEPALLYWRTRGCSTFADRDDIVNCTLKINGGTIGLDDRKTRLASAKRAFPA